MIRNRWSVWVDFTPAAVRLTTRSCWSSVWVDVQRIVAVPSGPIGTVVVTPSTVYSNAVAPAWFAVNVKDPSRHLPLEAAGNSAELTVGRWEHCYRRCAADHATGSARGGRPGGAAERRRLGEVSSAGERRRVR
ncbi:hypothetical protein AB0I91_13945 [Actinosynnema sp. NPDC049800]